MPRAKPTVTYQRDDVVLAKMRGFSAWPAMIVTDDQLSDDVKQARASSKKQYTVRFIPDADYQFFGTESLQPLPPEAASKFLNKLDENKGKIRGKNAPTALIEAYNMAVSGALNWAREQDAIVAKACLYYEQVEPDVPAAPPRRSHKKRVTQAGEEAKPTKKRAPRVDSDDAAETEALLETQPATKRKRKSVVDGSKSGESAGDATGADLTTPGDANVAAAEAAGIDASQIDEESVNDLKVKCWRFELQRIFLGKTGILLDSMGRAAEQFDQLEAFPQISARQLQFSKIHKVLRKIVGIKGQLPAHIENKYHFTTRSQKLLREWKPLLANLTEGA